MPKEEIKDDGNVASVGEETLTSETEPTAEKKDKKGLGTGAIVGLSIAGVVLLAGVGVGGAAIGATIAHNDRPAVARLMDGKIGQMAEGRDGHPGRGHHDGDGPMGERGVDPDGDNWTGQNKQGQMGQGGQMPMQPAPSATATPGT